jgi:hypothetical protein
VDDFLYLGLQRRDKNLRIHALQAEGDIAMACRLAPEAGNGADVPTLPSDYTRHSS